MKAYLLIVLMISLLSGCFSAKVADPLYSSHLKNVRSDLAITYCEKNVKLKHIAALEWLDSNKVSVGAPSSDIRDFLSLALVKIDKKETILYKFPLAPPAGNRVLSDEPRAQYNHYSIWVNKDTGLITEKRFNRYKW
jgi:hypothetical protein